VLRADWFGPDAALSFSAALPDGSVLVSYDTNPYVPGDDEGNLEEREPGLVVLRPDGSCEPFVLPSVDGRHIGEDARPVAVDAAERLYLYDGAAHRVVRGPTDGTWETVATIPVDVAEQTGVSAVAIGADDEVYVLSGFRISTVAADGTLVPAAGNGEDFLGMKGLGPLPRSATSASLPFVREIEVLPTGGLVMASRSTLLTLKDGTLDVLADAASTAGQEGAFVQCRRLGGMHPLPSGDLLVSDAGGKRILRLSGDGRSSVFLTESPVSLVSANPALADGRGLLLRGQGILAVYGIPPG